MAGHSKWATIKRKKGALDAKRGQLFTKLAKNISVAARGGSDPEMNAALRVAVSAAKRANMPKDNIEKAILKGAGELPGVVYEEITYEGYGPGGVAIIIECVTDNNNRSVAFVRSTLSKNGGSLGNSGSVLYMFNQKGVISIAKDDIAERDQDEIEMMAIEAGAEDIKVEEEGITIITAREDFHSVSEVLEKAEVNMTEAGIEYITDNMIPVDEAVKGRLEKLLEILDDNEDVNKVYTNADM